MPIKLSVLTRPLKEKIRNSDHTELKSSAFWIGHMLMIAATIIGVYLAAQAGLRQAILFDELTGLQRSFHVRTALADELQHNIGELKAYQQNYLNRQLSTQELQQNNPGISHYVWDAMKQSPATLEIPSMFLNGVQRFYQTTSDIIRKSEQRIYAASHGSKLLSEQIQTMETQIIPALRDSINAIEATLQQQGINAGIYGAVEHD